MMAASGVKADITADWKLHMPFDSWAKQVVETPSRVYFISRTFEERRDLPGRDTRSHSLFYYDKAGDEIISVNDRVNANGNTVSCIGYNYDKKYLLVVYTDCNIDFIYDDGRVYNVAALKATPIQGKKEVNHITFDNANSRAYLATTFGYVALNDERHEVAESRNYAENIRSVARCGENVVMLADDGLFYAPAKDQRFNLTEYTYVGGTPNMDCIVPLATNDFIAYKATGQTGVDRFRWTGNGFEWEMLYEDVQMYGAQQIADGNYQLTGNVRLTKVFPDGKISEMNRPNDAWGDPAASLNNSDIWDLKSRKGLRSFKGSPDNWAVSRDFMRPNAPATFISSSFAYSPTYGMLAGSNGIDFAFSETSQNTPSNISGLKNGFWKEYGFYYSGNNALANTSNYGGLSIDPQNPDHVYRGSTTGGIMRVNLANPAEILIMANPSNANAGKEGFIKIQEDMSAWNQLCRFSTPQFATDGTMWSLHYNRNQGRGELWYWPAADRLATTNAANYRPMKNIPLPSVYTAGNNDVMITLAKNKNIVVLGGHANYGTVLVYDHNGTPDNTTDDRYVYLVSPYDQDGGGVSFMAVNNLYEDPATGLVWILSQRGVFTFNPATIFDNPNVVNRIKVARNDGTNLADYLLNEINVNGMATDGEGRKWFATSNGMVCTSQDGRSILGEFTTENSYLPGENVYAVGYNPDSNSMMLATDSGLAELFPSGSGGGALSEASEVRVYPNPVEPDYYGWVRIDNIAEGSLVKITDAKGGVVKELGPAQAGSVEWDVSGLNNTRVATGVYYVMVSPASGGEGKTSISKILVLN